ncbi:flagellar hook-associated protein FlgK [Georgenia yuyongxinii]|uniref:Flagellar hook-associated protein 1 n=1 Tax=Georgenia yuyongxinii TaxID=2589797 RepID=A0A5B8BYY5_9MICO|nr:flagellar hook-associated protein FlgK [Georgenia yuyongxinii]QDC23629.1 flagellar hook-associated protein FlgK [Georgenia yuyongxinii]
MSTFSTLNGALTSLIAQRQALEVAGQNIANVNTPGYTRQRANLQAIDGSVAASMHTTPGATVNGGVRVTAVERLGDVFLEARVRQETAGASFLDAVAETWSLLQSTIAEPGEKGLAAALDIFFTSWEAVANRPDDPAARAVLLENANTLVGRIAGGHRAVEAQWNSSRAQARALATDVNTAADAVADLNARIRAVTVTGGSPNALIDERNVVLTQLSSLVGAEARFREDGTVDVMVGGNALVRGDKTNHVDVIGANIFADLGQADATDTGSVRLVWAGTTRETGATGGRLSGLLSTLAPANKGGAIAGLAENYNTLASSLAAAVNTAHARGTDLAGSPAAADPSSPSNAERFFRIAGAPSATRISVLITDGANIRAADPLKGALDGSIAAEIADLADALGKQWSQAVVNLGVQTRTAGQRATNAESTRAVASDLLTAQAGVNLDEETVNLLAYQRAYEAAARVITSVDQILDTLINRTGIVGR